MKPLNRQAYKSGIRSQHPPERRLALEHERLHRTWLSELRRPAASPVVLIQRSQEPGGHQTPSMGRTAFDTQPAYRPACEPIVPFSSDQVSRQDRPGTPAEEPQPRIAQMALWLRSIQSMRSLIQIFSPWTYFRPITGFCIGFFVAVNLAFCLWHVTCGDYRYIPMAYSHLAAGTFQGFNCGWHSRVKNVFTCQ